jgi:hypothetical protein
MARPITITAAGNAQVSTAQSKFGGASALFDGNLDYLSVNHGTDLRFGTGNFTFEMWFRPNARTTQYPMLLTNTAGWGSNTFQLHDRHDAANTKITFWSHNFNSGSPLLTSSTNITNGTWYHIAIVRNGTSFKMYVNGIEEASATSSVNIDSSLGSTYYAGGRVSSATESFNGWIDEVRISNNARYTSNFTPSSTAFSSDANTLLLIHANGTDASTTFTDDNSTGVIEEGAAAISVISTIYCVPGDTDPFYIESGYIDAGYYESFGVLQEVESDLYVVANLTCSLLLIKNASAEFDATANLSCILQLFKNASAEFNATVNFSSPIELIKDASVALTATASVSCTISHIEGADLFAFTEAAIAVQVDRIRDNNIAATSVFTVATDVERIQQGNADADAIFSAIINGLRSRDVNLETQAAFSFDVQEDLFKNFTVSISSEASVIANVQVTRDANAALVAEANITAVADKLKIISETLSSEFSISAIADRIRDNNSEMSGVFDLQAELTPVGAILVLGTGDIFSEFLIVADTDISLIKSSDVNLNSQFSLEANANYIVDNVIITDSIASILTAVVKTVAVDIPLDSNFVVGADVSRIRGVEINVSAIAETIISAVKTTSTTDLLSSAFTQTAITGRIRDVEITTDAIASSLTAVVRIAGLLISSNVVSTLTASGVVNRSARGAFISNATIASAPVKQSVGSAAISSTGSVNAITGFRKEFNSDIASALTFVVAIRDLRLDEIVYVIPGENYVYEIISESRLHDIYGETRIRSVLGESRNRRITGESRIHIID